MKRIKRGWGLTRKSAAVLRSNKALVKFPIFGGIAAALMTIVIFAPGLYLIEEDSTVAGAILAILGLYVLALIGTFFNVGLAGCADDALHDRPTSFGAGMVAARGRFGPIAGWAIVSTVVGTIIGILQDKGGIAGIIFGGLLQVGWSLVTFMAVPVIALEGLGPFATIKRSSGLFAKKWGEQVTGNVAIGGFAFLIGFLPGLALVFGGIAVWASSGFAGAILVALGVIIIAVAMIVQTAISVIFGVALYRYATANEVVGTFTAEEFEATITGGRRGGLGGPASTGGTI